MTVHVRDSDCSSWSEPGLQDVSLPLCTSALYGALCWSSSKHKSALLCSIPPSQPPTTLSEEREYMRGQSSKTDEAAMREESNSSQRIERIEIVLESDASIDAVIAAPTLSLTGGDGTFLLPVLSGPIMCSVAAGQVASSINVIPDAMTSPRESPGVDDTLPVPDVNGPSRSFLEVGQSPPRIDEVTLSPNMTPEDSEAGEVRARGPPTSPNVDFIEFLMEAINIFIGFLAIFMALVSVLVSSNGHIEFAVLVLNLISWVTMLITFVAVAIHRGVEWKLDYVEIFVTTVLVDFDIICKCLKFSSRSINIVILVLSVGLFSLKLGRKYQKGIDRREIQNHGSLRYNERRH